MTAAVTFTPEPIQNKFVPTETPDCFEDGEENDHAKDSKTPATVASTPGSVSSSSVVKAGSVTRVRGVGLADFEVTLAGTVGYLAIGRRIHGYLAAFRAVRPLVVQLLMLKPRVAYSTFKVYSRLQRLCQNPYLPDLTMGSVLDPIHKPADEALVHALSRYLKFAAAVYPAQTLMNHDVTAALELGRKATMTQLIKQYYPKAKVLLSRDKPEPKRPGFAVCALDSHKEVIVSIQGSHTKSDWITNIVCNPSDISGQHHGMKLAALNLDEEIRDTLVSFLRNGRRDWKVTLVGHSLGGGTSTLLAIRWINLLPEEHRHQVQAYSFGAPCVVSQKDALRYKDQIFSIIFGRDVVSRLSFGTVRDLLVTLHGLSASWKVAGLGNVADVHNGLLVTEDTQDDEHDEDDEDSESAASDAEVDILGEEDDISEVFEDSSQASTTAPGSEVGDSAPETRSYAPGMKGADRRALLRRDLTLAKLTLPISFKELRRLVRQRARELDERINQFRVEPRKPNWFSRVFKRGKAPKSSEMKPQELHNESLMLKDALQRIMNIHESPENEMMMPAGSTILIIPKLHFLIADQIPPKETLRDGQCALIRFEGEALVRLLREPVWHSDAIKDHSINCYFQGIDPFELKTLPRHNAILTPSQAMAQNKRKNAPVATSVSMKPGELSRCLEERESSRNQISQV